MSGQVAAIVAVRTILGLVLVAAGVSKLAEGRGAFLRVVQDYRLLPGPLAVATARGLPWTEIAAGVSLCLGVATAPAALLAAALFTAFAAGIAINLRRGRTDIACGCFGSAEHRLSWSMVARNVGLTAAAAVVAVSSSPVSFAAALPIALSAIALSAIALVLATTRRLRLYDFSFPEGDDAADGAPHERLLLPLARAEESS